MEIKKKDKKEQKIVSGYFSQEFYMSRGELSEFLRNLADQVESNDELRITTEEWILPFNPMSQAKVDVDLDDEELEIEIEFKKSTGKLRASPVTEESSKESYMDEESESDDEELEKEIEFKNRPEGPRDEPSEGKSFINEPSEPY
jgi:amphi-Trp domain-containing protein